MKHFLLLLSFAMMFASCKANTKAPEAAEKKENPASAEKSAEKVSAKEAAQADTKATKTPTATVATATADGQPAQKGGCGYGVDVAAAGGSNDKSPAAKSCGGASGCGGCGGGAAAAPIAKDGATHYGKPFKMTDTTKLDDVLASADKFNGKDIRVTARISKVCKKKGCWFVLAGDAPDGKFVRVTTNHGFFVPVDCDGKTVVVEGTFRKVELRESTRKHLAEDGNEDPNKVKGGGVELTLIASGAQIKS